MVHGVSFSSSPPPSSKLDRVPTEFILGKLESDKMDFAQFSTWVLVTRSRKPSWKTEEGKSGIAQAPAAGPQKHFEANS